jgi:NitT/TauT family transport system substrate-binding protein
VNPSDRRRASRRMTRLVATIGVTLAMLALTQPAAGTDKIRIAVLKFGTVSWQLDVIKRHRLDQAEGIDLDPMELAAPQATLVALQAGETDMAVSDWLWVARQRDAGRPFTFVPYSTATGALVVPRGSPITSLKDLSGKRLGVAGGPLDKSWLLLRALSLKQLGTDLAAQVEPVYAAPPLLNEEIRQDRLDAVLNYWPYAARLTAEGMRPLLEVRDVREELGVASDVPMVGYVFDEHRAATHKHAFLGFFRAVSMANTLLLNSDEEWERLRPLMGAPDQATFEALRAGYRAGVPRHWGDAERKDAERLFDVLRSVGGSRLVGDAARLPAGTFWANVTF